MVSNDIHQKLQEILFPNYSSRIKAVKDQNLRFVHYTTAETAFNIIRSKSLWMRNLLTMNDLSEFKHGIDCIEQALSSDVGKNLFAIFDNLFPNINISSKVHESFKNWTNYGILETFISCFSEHTQDDDLYGRLSMWRAYGGKTGVALVFKSSPFLSLLDPYKISSSSIAYLNYEGINTEINTVISSINQNANFLKLQNPNLIEMHFNNMLKYASLCNKHPSFKEEKEWRLLYSAGDASKLMLPQTQLINGVPQILFKLPLQDERGLNLSIPNVLDRIIIGPCAFPDNTYSAFSQLLRDEGVEDIYKKLFISGVPLRH